MTKRFFKTMIFASLAIVIAVAAQTSVSAATKNITVRQIAKMSVDVDMADYVDDNLPVTSGKGHCMKVDREMTYILSKIVGTKKDLFLVWDWATDLRSSETTKYFNTDEMFEVFIDQNTSKGVKKWHVIYDENQNMEPWYVESEDDGQVYESRKVGKYCWKLTPVSE